jgi:hypothetical protein
LCIKPAAVPQGDDDRGSSVYSQITHAVELRGHGGSPCVFHRGLSTVGWIKLVARTVYRKWEKSRILNIIEGLQIPDILDICYLYNFLWKYVKKYISIQASIFLFVSSVLKHEIENICCQFYSLKQIKETLVKTNYAAPYRGWQTPSKLRSRPGAQKD